MSKSMIDTCQNSCHFLHWNFSYFCMGHLPSRRWPRYSYYDMWYFQIMLMSI